jgi:asparagine synthetase B (glutamine-hydrolysing)
VLVGQGGDQLFSENMLQPIPAPTPLARGAFSASGWREVERARGLMHASPVFFKRSTLTYLHDARLDVVMKEAFGASTRSPFTDLDVVRCGLSWAKVSARLGTRRMRTSLCGSRRRPCWRN